MKAGTSECISCHNRFDKPDMKELTWSEASGSSVGIYNIGGKKKKASARQYYRKKTGWICEKCNANRPRILTGIALLVTLGMTGLPYLISKRTGLFVVILLTGILGSPFFAGIEGSSGVALADMSTDNMNIFQSLLVLLASFWGGYYEFFAGFVSGFSESKDIFVFPAGLHMLLVGLSVYEYFFFNAKDGKGVPLKAI
jgi:hypothetical protein